MEAGARPASLPASLGFISSGFFQDWPAWGREAGMESLFPSKGSRVFFPGPVRLAQGRHRFFLVSLSGYSVSGAVANQEDQVPGDFVLVTSALFEVVLKPKVEMDKEVQNLQCYGILCYFGQCWRGSNSGPSSYHTSDLLMNYNPSPSVKVSF